MSLHRVQNIFIGDGTALPAGGSDITTVTVASGDLALAGVDMEAMSPGDTVADQAAFYVFEGRTSTTAPLKRSMMIPGRKVTSYLGSSYKPASRDVWAIGYNRKTATGSIDPNDDEDYQFYITFKNDKHLYSERMLKRSLTFRSATTGATQLSVATQIAAAINGDQVSADQVTAIVVGDGTGQYGVTGATNYGVEITGKILTQSSTFLQEERVYFTVNIEDFTSGFGTTTVSQIENMTYGKGTYPQVSLAEKRNISYEGVLNFTRFPIPTQIYAASSTLVTSANVSATTGNVSITISEDVATVTSNTILRAGEIIDIDGTQYEIKYLIGTTQFVITSLATATYSGANLKVKYGYDSIVIEFSNPNLLQGAGVVQDNLQGVLIMTPAINASGAYNSTSTQGTDVLAILNPYMASLDFANITL